MEYTIQKLGRLAGVSSRTLRYYDEIGLLKPARTNSSGYRIYGQNEVDLLQQILFYRELDVPLEHIREIMHNPEFNGEDALREHRGKLLDRRRQLDALIASIDQTLDAREGRTTMTDQDKFAGFKQKLLEENEQKYGAEIREKYGKEAVQQSNAKFGSLSEAQYNDMQQTEKELFAALKEAMESGDPAGEAAQRAADLHKHWLSFTWPQYSKEAHAGLARMYVDDSRFKAYYDSRFEGAALMLRDAILHYIAK
ncbi:MerR family transcriptional regulator [Paenibacillus brevis]|uniref:MerR family transcriptional regulator n=1 Tax=Paenibacillus brevis TaxID=2841508 RepID=A0ABS6FVJ4_9BACL|nr:MerR family transcriptional regulator [Paenibacillus brevis]MBU5673408.1 MerR family transcriptional regulator [Paenibacillus brevis]